jgi:hypothetical protein
MLRGAATLVAQLFHRAPQRARTASPLLAYLAGDFADAIARIWPAPHGDFFALPAARRHAVAMALAGHIRRPTSDAELRRLVEYQRDAAVAEAFTRIPPTGLMRALAKAGEQLWRREEYDTFVALMAEPMANEVLRHLDDVRPAAFGPIALLPETLRMASVVRVLPSSAAAHDLARAFRLAACMREPGASARIARRWGAGGDIRAVFSRAVEDLTPDVFRPAGPAPVLGASFVAITGRKQLEAVALEFRNCLAEHGARVAEGRLAVYVWRAEPLAAIALSRDAAGWRLAEAKAADNVDLEEGFLRQLAARLDLAGVRTGPSVQTVSCRLGDWADGNAYPREYRASFIDDLALGDLWS